MDKSSTPVDKSAPSTLRDAVDREQIKALATASALTIPGECSHCGRIDEQVVHAFGHQWFGENWELAELHAAIDAARYVRWENAGGYDLVLEHDGRPYRFQVQDPAQAKAAGSAA